MINKDLEKNKTVPTPTLPEDGATAPPWWRSAIAHLRKLPRINKSFFVSRKHPSVYSSTLQQHLEMPLDRIFFRTALAWEQSQEVLEANASTCDRSTAGSQPFVGSDEDMTMHFHGDDGGLSDSDGDVVLQSDLVEGRNAIDFKALFEIFRVVHKHPSAHIRTKSATGIAKDLADQDFAIIKYMFTQLSEECNEGLITPGSSLHDPRAISIWRPATGMDIETFRQSLEEWEWTPPIFFTFADLPGDVDVQFAEQATRNLVSSNAFEGTPCVWSLFNDASQSSLGLLAALDKFLLWGVVVCTEVLGDTTSWQLTKQGYLSLKGCFRIRYKRTVFHKRGDLPLKDCTTWELVDFLFDSHWQHKVLPFRARRDALKAYDHTSDGEKSERVWYSRAGARTLSRPYLMALAKSEEWSRSGIFCGKIKHLEDDRYYSSILQQVHSHIQRGTELSCFIPIAFDFGDHSDAPALALSDGEAT